MSGPSESIRARLFIGSQSDPAFLTTTLREALGGAPADIVIDDASHLALETKVTFDTLFDEWLAPGGLYVIEDRGTGYLPGWLDGQRLQSPGTPAPERSAPWTSHSVGMVWLLKRFVDELTSTRRRPRAATRCACPASRASSSIRA